jgi:hypothetical protein
MQTESQLGLLNFGEDKPEKPNLPAARHAIDLLAMIAEKTRGNLVLEEQRLIENALTELRFRFVQASEQAVSSKSDPSESDQPPADTAAS